MNGEEIELEKQVISNRKEFSYEYLVIYKPKSILLPNTIYQLQHRIIFGEICWDFAECLAKEWKALASFTTSSTYDKLPPDAVVLTNQSLLPAQRLDICPPEDRPKAFCCEQNWSIRKFLLQWEEPNFLEKEIRYNIYYADDLSTPAAYSFENEIIVAAKCAPYWRVPSLYFLNYNPAGYVIRAVDLAGNEDKNTNIIYLQNPCPSSGEANSEAGGEISTNQEPIHSESRRDEPEREPPDAGPNDANVRESLGVENFVGREEKSVDIDIQDETTRSPDGKGKIQITVGCSVWEDALPNALLLMLLMSYILLTRRRFSSRNEDF